MARSSMRLALDLGLMAGALSTFGFLGAASLKYAGVTSFGIGAAAQTLTALGVGTVAGVFFVGGIATAIAALLFKRVLDYCGLLNEINDIRIQIAASLLSGPAGALLFGLDIQPFIICAVIAVAMSLIIAGILDFKGCNKDDIYGRSFNISRLFA